MKPATYIARIRVDNNGNGFWDEADFAQNIAAEDVYIFEKVIEQHKNTLLMKIKEDSIMYMQSQIEIGKLNKNIKDNIS